MSNKETTVEKANDRAKEQAKNAHDCEKMIVAEAMKIASGEEHSVQQMLAYCRQLKKYTAKK